MKGNPAPVSLAACTLCHTEHMRHCRCLQRPNSRLAHPPQVVARDLPWQIHQALTEAGNER